MRMGKFNRRLLTSISIMDARPALHPSTLNALTRFLSHTTRLCQLTIQHIALQSPITH